MKASKLFPRVFIDTDLHGFYVFESECEGARYTPSGVFDRETTLRVNDMECASYMQEVFDAEREDLIRKAVSR